MVESSSGAKVEFEPRNPLPFHIAKLVHHKGEEMCKLKGWPTFNLFVLRIKDESSFKFRNLIIINLTEFSTTFGVINRKLKQIIEKIRNNRIRGINCLNLTKECINYVNSFELGTLGLEVTSVIETTFVS